MDKVVHIDYRDRRPVYSQIVDGFRDQIRAGVLTDGDKLPSVRELAAQLAINPNTIQRAYRELEMQGWVKTHPGKGCFVCGVPVAANPGRQALLQTFDQTVQALIAAGATREELINRLTEGGNEHASDV